MARRMAQAAAPSPQGPSEAAVAQEQQGGGDVKKLVENIHTDLSKLQEILGGANVSPEVVQGLEGVRKGYQKVIMTLVGGAGPEAAPQAPPVQAAVPAQPPRR